MSTASKITLGLALGVSSAIIGYVHYKQSEDRLKLHQGVLRDVEQQQRRKHENTYSLQKQIDITKQLKTVLEQEAATIQDKSMLIEHNTDETKPATKTKEKVANAEEITTKTEDVSPVNQKKEYVENPSVAEATTPPDTSTDADIQSN